MEIMLLLGGDSFAYDRLVLVEGGGVCVRVTVIVGMVVTGTTVCNIPVAPAFRTGRPPLAARTWGHSPERKLRWPT